MFFLTQSCTTDLQSYLGFLAVSESKEFDQLRQASRLILERSEYVPGHFRARSLNCRILQAFVCIAYGQILIFKGANLEFSMISVDSLKAGLSDLNFANYATSFCMYHLQLPNDTYFLLLIFVN